MLILWAMEPDYRKSSADNEILELVDNYSPIYDDELEVIYENLESRELFEECDHIHERIRIGQSKVFAICYNVLRIWHNEVLTIDGQKQNNIVTLSGDYTNDGSYYQDVFLKLFLFDDLGDVVDIGLAKIVDVTQNDFRHFSVSTPYKGKINSCLVMIDSKFPQE